MHKASASRQQATSREPQQADKMRSAGSGSNNACPSASNKTPKEIITTVQPAGISWLAAIRGSRTRQQQAASSSNTHSKQQAGGRRPAGKRRATKNATMNGRGEHRYHALQQCAASLGGRDDPFSQSSETPFAASTLGSVACRASSEANYGCPLRAFFFRPAFEHPNWRPVLVPNSGGNMSRFRCASALREPIRKKTSNDGKITRKIRDQCVVHVGCVTPEHWCLRQNMFWTQVESQRVFCEWGPTLLFQNSRHGDVSLY